ncbi:MAG: exodeoxyribonuclease VII large subunit [Burkholderiales bacterium]
MIDVTGASARRSVWSVAALVREVADLVGAGIGACTVRGEISGFSRAASGHCYFNVKDADGGTAMIRCAMFRRAASLLAFAPGDGQLVELRGRLGVYEPRGELQFVVEAMQRAGAGALYEQFLRIKAKLEAEGLFDAARKRALPAYPATIGVVTSLGAAALHDVLTALARRAPHVGVVVYPSLVQGTEAPALLAEAVAQASHRAEVDVLLVCRGGGSLEDLWTFNDERVVRAICAATMPVVCGVGHETDVTLADFAADLRAPTPTAAAELATPTRDECLQVLEAYSSLISRRIHDAIDLHAQRLDRAALRLTRPAQGVRRQGERLTLLAHRLASHAPRALQTQRSGLAQVQHEMQHRVAMRLASERQRVESLAARLRALDPSQVLARGYAWLSDAAGVPVMSVTQMRVGDPLRAVLHDGAADVEVTGLRP